MAIAGQSDVDTFGQFSQAIPIVMPPGTAGMAPALSLAYSSAAGDGFEGLGWSLVGLSAIIRCPRTQPIDSIHGGVNYNHDDRFCLNGQRLMLVTGSYGDNGATYGTYIDGKANIIQHCVVSTCPNGPDWFEVQLKNGTVLELGNTTDSRVLAVGKTVARAWLLNKRTDVKGNYLKVSYINDATNGQAYPVQIDYTANDTTTPALNTYNSVKFFYGSSDRLDVVPAYKAGSLMQITKLLTNIKTLHGLTVVLDYRLAYEHGSATTHSRLKTVTQCDGLGNCLAPTTFTWQGGTGTLTPTMILNTLLAGATLSDGDFNGDGINDAMAFTNASCPSGGIVWLGDVSGAFTAGNLTASYHYKDAGGNLLSYSGPLCFPSVRHASAASIADFNANGLADIFAYQLRGVATVTNPLINDGAGNQSEAQTAPASQELSLIGDFNGDGRTDGFDIGLQQAYFSTGTGTFTADTTRAAASANLAADFDGDGCTDILQQGSTNGVVYYCNPAVATASAPNLTGSAVVQGDFNGDGITDLLSVNSTAALLYLGTGTGFITTPYTVPSSSTWHNYKVVAGDWNGDGKTDVALLSQAVSSQHLIFLSSGTGFTQVATINTSAAETVTGAVADWNSDGADDLWLQKASGDVEYTFYSSAYEPELLKSVNNGLSAAERISVVYDRFNKNGTFYTKGAAAAYQYLDLNGPYYAVSQVTHDNGVGGSYHTSYTYAGAIVDVTAPPTPGPTWNFATKGILTLTSITATDSRTGLVTTTTYRTDLPFAGLPSSEKTTNGPGGQEVNNVSINYSNQGRGGANGVRLTIQSVTKHDLNGATISSTATEFLDYDFYSNPLWIRQTWPDSSRHEIHNTFSNETSPWILGQLTSTTVEGILGTYDITRTFSYTPDAATGFTIAQIAEPGSTTMKLETDYHYDQYGNLDTLTQKGSAISTRTTTAQYNGSGGFLASVTDALTHATNVTFDANFGGRTSITDPNSAQSAMVYDTFGRPTFGTKSDTNKENIAYAYCSGVNGGSASCPTGGAYVVTTTPETSTSTPTSGTQNGVANKTYYDALDRVIATDVEGFDGTSTSCMVSAPCWIRTSTSYDGAAHVYQTSRPYLVSGGSPVYTTYAYDVLDRVTTVTYPDATQATSCYNGMTTSTTNAKGQIKIVIRNVQNLVATVIDGASGDCLSSSPTGVKTTYAYDPFGNPTTITDNANNTTTNTFDTRGRRTGTSDPDMGTWTFVYDALNELTDQIDAKTQSTHLTYDKLMRPSTRTEDDLFSRWTYDARPNGVGQLANACVNTSCSAGNYWQQPSYDAYDRVNDDRLTLDGTAYHYQIAYNSDGRVDTVTYPSGFVAKYVYTSLGYLQQIQDNSTSAVIWTANRRDAELRLTKETAGNGVATTQTFDSDTGNVLTICAATGSGVCNIASFTYNWDDIGNLTSRKDGVANKTEHFCYDGLNRVTSAKLTASTSCPQTGGTAFEYDTLGNITKKSDVCSASNCFVYGGSGAGPHQLTSIAGTYNGATNPTFAYDDNGNMTGGANRNVDYTSFDMASSLSNGSSSMAIAYGAWHGRYKACVPDCTTPSTTTTYLVDTATGAYSEKVVTATATTWRDYIVADGQIVALRTRTGSAAATMLYIAPDHLGSTAVVTDTATPMNIERDSYDAWGRRRNPDGTPDPSCALTSQTNRGYIAQEVLDSQCLINMNARIYDPTLAQFQSADSIVSDPDNSQAYNRYAYVLGNPLNATDPSGNIPCWGCYGPGFTSDQNGNPIPVAQDAFYHDLMFEGIDEPFDGRLIDLTQFLKDHGYITPGSGGYWIAGPENNKNVDTYDRNGNLVSEAVIQEMVFVSNRGSQSDLGGSLVASGGGENSHGDRCVVAGGNATGGGNGRTYFGSLSANAAVILGGDLGVSAYYNPSAQTGGVTFQWGALSGGTFGASATGGYQNGGLGSFLSSNKVMGGNVAFVSGGVINSGNSASGGYYGGLGLGFPVGAATGTINVVPLLQVGAQACH